MARPREFNADDALDCALDVFWTKGYEATSMADLTRAMGLSKSSLYDTFGSKHELFLSTLDRYNKVVASRDAASVIEGAGGGMAGIIALFRRYADDATADGPRRGCFLNNCAVEVCASDTEAAKHVSIGLGCLDTAFLAAVKQAQADGDIPAGRDPKRLARYLTSSINGLLVVAKANPDRAALQDVIDTVIVALS